MIKMMMTTTMTMQIIDESLSQWYLIFVDKTKKLLNETGIIIVAILSNNNDDQSVVQNIVHGQRREHKLA